MSILDIFKKNFTRKAYRRKASFSVNLRASKVKQEWDQSEYLGDGSNISPKGMQIETTAPLSVGDLLLLTFSLRQGSKTVEVAAVVRNKRSGAGGKNTIGLEFHKPSPEVSKYLATILLLYK